MTIINNLPFNLQNGTTADATQVDANFNEVVTDTNNNAAHNGVNTDITALSALVTPITPAQGGTNVYVGGTSGGSANAQTVATPVPSGFALTAGNRITCIAGFTNSTTMTLAVNSLAATTVKVNSIAGLQALIGGEVVSGNIYEWEFDGTEFILLNPSSTPAFGALTILASATSTDLGTVPSHNVNITGTTTITGFGSTAQLAFPVYNIVFSGALTLTYDGTAMILPGLANITTAANDSAVALYLGSGHWQIIDYQRASGTTVVAATPLGGAVGLTIQNNAATPDTKVDVAADQVVMLNTSGVSISALSVSVTINATVNGANGLDTGALATSTWYNIWLISNGTVTAALASLSATAPTMPSGYTYKVRMGAMKTDGSSKFLRSVQLGSWVQYKVVSATNTAAIPNIANGAAGTPSATAPTYAAASVTGVVPPTATHIAVQAMAQYGNNTFVRVQVAPNAAYSGGSSSNGPYYDNENSGGTGAPNTACFVMQLEAATIAWTSGGTGGAINCPGWKDKVNAS